MKRYLLNKNKTVILDEVQKIPSILDEVHRLIENEGLQFVLTGSSARKLKQKGVNLLAGRALTFNFFPLTAFELSEDFDLKFALRFGMLPKVWGKSEPKRFLKSYVKTYLKEEIFQEGLTRSLPAFSRFLEAASFSQGSLLNLSAVAQDCAVPRKSVENYFEILEDILLGVRVPCFTMHAKRKVVTHPKFYFFDTGVFRSLRPKGPLDLDENLDGIALETLVFQELRALNAYFEFDYAISFWRTESVSEFEVDFILYGEKGLKAFEVKKTSKLRSSDFRGLKAFLEDYPMAQPYLLYGGERELREGPIKILPISQFFKSARQLLE